QRGKFLRRVLGILGRVEEPVGRLERDLLRDDPVELHVVLAGGEGLGELLAAHIGGEHDLALALEVQRVAAALPGGDRGAVPGTDRDLADAFADVVEVVAVGVDVDHAAGHADVARAEVVGDRQAAPGGHAAGADLAHGAHHVLAVAAGRLHAAGAGAGVDDESLMAVVRAARAGERVLRPAAALEARLLDP